MHASAAVAAHTRFHCCRRYPEEGTSGNTRVKHECCGQKSRARKGSVNTRVCRYHSKNAIPRMARGVVGAVRVAPGGSQCVWSSQGDVRWRWKGREHAHEHPRVREGQGIFGGWGCEL